MADVWTEYTPPRAVGLFSEVVPPNGGQCWPLAECGGDGMPHNTGSTPKRAPLVWGVSGSAPADAVWVELTDLGDLTGSLWGALVDNVLFLHLGEDAPTSAGAVLPESGCGFVGRVDGAGMLSGQGTGRHPGPCAYLCPMDLRDSFLKDAQGRWRAEVSWDVLCTAFYRTGTQQTSWHDYPSRVLTVWMVVAGNMLCFYTTVCDFHSAAGGQVYRARNWAAFGSVARCYGYNPLNEFDGVPAGQDWQDALGCTTPVVNGAFSSLGGFMNVAPLPWQDGGGGAVHDAGDWQDGDFCTLNVSSADDAGALAVGQSSFLVDGGIYVCPRLHFNSGLSAYSGGAQFTPGQVRTVLYGAAGDFPVFLPDQDHFYLGPLGAQGVYVPVAPGLNLLFDPWGVEGLGLHERTDGLAFSRRDARDWLPPVATDWRCVAAATLQGPAGPLYLDIAGAEMDGCLLTASGSTEFSD